MTTPNIILVILLGIVGIALLLLHQRRAPLTQSQHNVSGIFSAIMSSGANGGLLIAIGVGAVTLMGLMGWIPTPSPQNVLSWSSSVWLFVVFAFGLAFVLTSGAEKGSKKATARIWVWVAIALLGFAQVGDFAVAIKQQDAANAVKTRAALVAVSERYADLVCDGRERDVYVPPNPNRRSRIIHSGNADIIPTLAPASGRYMACTEYDVCYGPDTPVEKMSPHPRWYFKTAHKGDGFRMGYHCQPKDG